MQMFGSGREPTRGRWWFVWAGRRLGEGEVIKRAGLGYQWAWPQRLTL